MQRNLMIVMSTMSVALAGCEHRGLLYRPAPPTLVPVSQVVNAIKCEIAETFAGGAFADIVREDPQTGRDIQGVLSLSNVVAYGKSAEAGFETVPLGVTFGPSASYGRTRTSGQAYEIKFSYDLVDGAVRPDWCDNLPVKVEGDPFKVMLQGIKDEHSRIQAGDPKVKFGTIAYSSKFELKQESSVGAKVKFLVFSVGGKATSSRTEGQSLTLVFDLGLMPALIPPGG